MSKKMRDAWVMELPPLKIMIEIGVPASEPLASH